MSHSQCMSHGATPLTPLEQQMSRTKLRTSAAMISAAAVASLVGVAGPASASGGTPAPIPAGINCDTNPLVLSKIGPGIAVNWAGDAGCVGIKTTPTPVRLARGGGRPPRAPAAQRH